VNTNEQPPSTRQTLYGTGREASQTGRGGEQEGERESLECIIIQSFFEDRSNIDGPSTYCIHSPLPPLAVML
jgi:hypothetical protein